APCLSPSPLMGEGRGGGDSGPTATRCPPSPTLPHGGGREQIGRGFSTSPVPLPGGRPCLPPPPLLGAGWGRGGAGPPPAGGGAGARLVLPARCGGGAGVGVRRAPRRGEGVKAAGSYAFPPPLAGTTPVPAGWDLPPPRLSTRTTIPRGPV